MNECVGNEFIMSDILRQAYMGTIKSKSLISESFPTRPSHVNISRWFPFCESGDRWNKTCSGLIGGDFAEKENKSCHYVIVAHYECWKTKNMIHTAANATIKIIKSDNRFTNCDTCLSNNDVKLKASIISFSSIKRKLVGKLIRMTIANQGVEHFYCIGLVK